MPTDQQRYWDANLDPQNLEGRTEFDLEQELAFLQTPDQQYAWERLEPLAGRVVLELGPGFGANAIGLARRGATVIALDLSGARLQALRRVVARDQLAERILPVQGSAEALPLADASLDRAFTKSVLIHTQLEQAAAQLRRVLKADGRGVFIEPLTGNPFVNLYRARFAPQIWRELARYFGPVETRLLAAGFAGFERREFYLLGFGAFLFQYAARKPLLFRAALRLLHALDRALFRLLPPLRRRAWLAVMIAEKSLRR